jgi:hypothetical protein
VLEVGAIDVEVNHHRFEVEALMGLEVDVGVSDNVLNGDTAESDEVVWVSIAQDERDFVRGSQTLQQGFAAGQDHLAAAEEQDGAARITKAYGDGCELLPVVVCIRHVHAHAGKV